MDTAEQILPDRIIDDLQEADKNIVKITEIVLVLRSTKQKLNSIETRTPEEEIRLAHVNEELDRRLKELDEQFELVNQALTKMQEHTQTMICNQNANTTCDNGTSNAICCGSTEDLKKVVILNWDKKKEKPPQIMVLKSTDNCADAVCGNDRSNCSLFSVCETDNDVKSCCCQSSSDICEKSDESVQEDESMNAQMKSKICILNEQLENILNKNQNVRLKLKNAIQQNDLMEEALKRPAPFKYSATEGVRFPGKKEMEEKLFALKSIIMSLSNEFRKVQINQAKLKLAREIIEKYNEKLIICVCNKTPYNINTDTYIKVKKQEIKQIALQNKAINNELNNIIFDQNCAIQNNLKTVSEINKLEKALMDKKRKIEEYDVDNNEDVTTQLNKTNEEIETMELLIQERKQLLFDCNEKFTEVELETKEITYQTQELEDLVKQLSSNYHYNYDNLKSCYKEQLEEMVALPIVLKATHIKLQQETDLRVLAEENRDQLEREIKQVDTIMSI
ncbi:Hypothetical protein CINCED_3A005151 [Cinara cedri]|uniref:Uncharacterized protein n=1 Tax=Cinara cedri TaxID=506608 RepID=A0A5E4NGE7_9HEMI|nr:Hypothetical protein CINCED_3A005151 [Cinara cedri]